MATHATARTAIALGICLCAFGACPWTSVASEIELRSAVYDPSCSTVQLLGGTTITLTAPLTVNRSVTVTSSGDVRATLSGTEIPTGSLTSDRCARNHRMLVLQPPSSGVVLFAGVILADAPGGAVAVDSVGHVRFEVVRFVRNGQLDRTRGGAICSDIQSAVVGSQAGVLQVVDCELTSNSGLSGGAVDLHLWHQRQVLLFLRCSFTFNIASYDGGAVAIRADNAVATFSACAFGNNVAKTGAGGGLWVWSRQSVVVNVASTLFQANTAPLGGGMFTGSACSSSHRCPGEVVQVTGTTFRDNQAVAGAGVVVSAVRHFFSGCAWRSNRELDSGAHAASRGAGLLAAGVSMDIELHACTFENNIADLSTQIAMRSHMPFPGTLLINETTIAGDNTSTTAVMSVEFQPQLNVTILNSNVTGTLQLKALTNVTAKNSSFTSVVVQDGGAFQLKDSLTARISANMTVGCPSSSSFEGPAAVCKATNEIAARTQAMRIRDADFSYVGADNSGHPYVENSWEVAYFHLEKVKPSATATSLSFSTFEGSRDPSRRQLAVAVKTTDAFVCRGDAITLDCGGDAGLPWKYLGPLLGVLGIGLCLLLVKGILYYRTWALEQEGLLTLPSCCGCNCYRLLACVPFFKKDKHSDDNNMIGYGVIDFANDLKMICAIGQGNFGEVLCCVLARRGLRAARKVAVKVLKVGDHKTLLAEAHIMQNIVPHPCVVFLIGVTESPYALVSQLVEHAAELDDHLRRLQKQNVSGTERLAHTIKFLLQAAEGLLHIHSYLIVHCDVAPRNILIAQSNGPLSVQTAKINDFGLSRTIESATDEYVFSGEYTRYLAAPENYGMPTGSHGLPADVFMMACTVWEVVTAQWGHFKQFFQEGQGLCWPDLQVPDTLANRIMVVTVKGTRGQRSKRGIATLYDSVHTYHNKHVEDTAHLLHTFYLAKSLAILISAALSHDPEQRPTMQDLRDGLADLWEHCNPDGTLQTKEVKRKKQHHKHAGCEAMSKEHKFRVLEGHEKSELWRELHDLIRDCPDLNIDNLKVEHDEHDAEHAEQLALEVTGLASKGDWFDGAAAEEFGGPHNQPDFCANDWFDGAAAEEFGAPHSQPDFCANESGIQLEINAVCDV